LRARCLRTLSFWFINDALLCCTSGMRGAVRLFISRLAAQTRFWLLTTNGSSHRVDRRSSRQRRTAFETSPPGDGSAHCGVVNMARALAAGRGAASNVQQAFVAFAPLLPQTRGHFAACPFLPLRLWRVWAHRTTGVSCYRRVLRARATANDFPSRPAAAGGAWTLFTAGRVEPRA